MRIALREFKSGVSRYLERALAGEVIEITSDDRPVARLLGIANPGVHGVERMLTSGAAQWAGGKPALQVPVTLGGGGKPLSATVLEDRG